MADDEGWTKGHELATQYAIEAIRALVLSNGGAVVAILTFSGNAQNTRIDIPAVASSLGWFAAGLALALITATVGYLAQGSHTHELKRADPLEWAATAAALVSVALFVTGAVTALRGFQSPPSVKAVVVATPKRSCEDAVEFIQAQADPGTSAAHNPKLKSDAVLIRGGWVVLPKCK